MRHIDNNSFSTWLGKAHEKEKPLSIDDLKKRESTLIDLERDVKFATDELSRRRHGEPPKICVDFDVMYEASQLRIAGGRIPFWSALLFYLNAAKLVVLPGTLFETLKFFQRTSDQGVGRYENQFIQAFQSSKTIDERFFGIWANAGKSFKQRQLYQKRYIFSLIQSKCDIFSSSELNGFDDRLFGNAVSILAHSSRKEKIYNNRVDALNFTLVSQLFRDGSTLSPDCVLVSNSLALRNLQRTTIDPRHSIRERSKHVVWNPRTASIFQCLCAVSNTILDASELAWEVYQEVIDERRATQFAMDRVGSSGDKISPARRNYRSDISSLIFGVELHDRSSFLDSEEMPFEISLKNSDDIDAAHEKLNNELSEFLEISVAKHKLSNYSSIVNKQSISASISEVAVGQKFRCKKHFEISSEQSTSRDSILIYEDKVQLVIEGGITPLRFISAIDSVRSQVRSRLIKNSIAEERPDEDLCKIVILTKGVLIESVEFDLGWATLAPLDADGDETDSYLDEAVVKVVSRLRSLFLSGDEVKPKFFRLVTKYFDASFEGEVVVLTAGSVTLKEEFEVFFQALSDHKIENLGELVYYNAKTCLKRAYLPT